MAYNFPPDPNLNDTYTYNGRTFRWDGVQWQAIIVPTPNSAPVFISASPPPNPVSGALWYDTINDELMLFDVALGGGEWIAITQDVPGPTPPVLLSSSPPQNVDPGFLWFDLTNNTLYVRVSGPGGNTWEPTTEGNCGSSSTVVISATPPLNPASGDLWYDTINDSLKMWFVEPGRIPVWVPVTTSGPDIDTPVYVSASPPPNPVSGFLWYDTTQSVLKIWTVGPGGGSWTALYQQPGRAPAPVYISASPPPNPTNGSLWYNTTTSVLNLRENTVGGGEWVPLNLSPDCPHDYTRTFISSTPPANPVPGDLWWDSGNSNLNIWYVDLGGGQWVSVVPYPVNQITQQGGIFIGPIYGNYEIPDDPIAFVTVGWVENYVAAHPGPPGPPGPPGVTNLTDAADVDPTGLTDLSTFVYRASDAKWTVDVTTLDLVNGGNF